MADAHDHYLRAEGLLDEYQNAENNGVDDTELDTLVLKLQAANAHAALATADLLRQAINKIGKTT